MQEGKEASVKVTERVEVMEHKMFAPEAVEWMEGKSDPARVSVDEGICLRDVSM